MLDAIAALPFWQAFVGLWVIVMCRSNGTYWLGRAARALWLRRRAQAGAAEAVGPDDGPGSERAERLLSRYGPVAVALSYLTIGIQTAIHLSAGAMRMPLPFYVAGAAVGSVAWAAIYATIGMAVIEAWVAARSGAWWLVFAALAAAATAFWLWRRARQSLETRLEQNG